MSELPTVVTWGNIMCDLIFTGLPGLPVMGEEIYADGLDMSVGGGAALTALSMRRLGWKVVCMGRAGRDVFGDMALRMLSEEGVDTSLVQRFGSRAAPGNVTVALSFPHDRAFVTHQPAGPWNYPAQIDSGRRHHHFAGYEGREKIMRDISSLESATVSLDTGWCEGSSWRREVLDLLRWVDVFFPNEREALYLSGEDDVVSALRFLSKICQRVVVTLGPSGALTLDDGREIRAPGFDVCPVDTTGCGDAFAAGFLDGWLTGSGLETCLRWGNALGAIVASSAGSLSSFGNREEIRAFMERGCSWPPDRS